MQNQRSTETSSAGAASSRLGRAPGPRQRLLDPRLRLGTHCLRGSASILLLLILAGCGYNVGAPFNPEIRSVHVPIFKSSSNRRFLEYQLTEAVQKQIQQRSHFRLVEAEDAETRLTGRIIDLRKNALGQTRNSDARELQVNLAVELTWEDVRTGKMLRQGNIPIPPDLLQVASQAEFAPEVGQSLATADQTAIDRLARNIVDMMENPW